MKKFSVIEFCHDHSVKDTLGVQQMSVLHIYALVLISSFCAYLNVLSHLQTPPSTRQETTDLPLLTAPRVLKGNQARQK